MYSHPAAYISSILAAVFDNSEDVRSSMEREHPIPNLLIFRSYSPRVLNKYIVACFEWSDIL